MLHRARDLLFRQRTMLINAVRAHLAELGVVVAKGPIGVAALGQTVDELPEGQASSDPMLTALRSLMSQLCLLGAEIDRLDKALLARHRASEQSRILATIPGVGPITASAITATVADPGVFRSSRQSAAWLGLTPRANSSGGRERQAGITKQGDSYLRRLLVVGATAVIRAARKRNAKNGWLARLLERKRPKVAAVAPANKMARIVWAVLVRGEPYRARVA